MHGVESSHWCCATIRVHAGSIGDEFEGQQHMDLTEQGGNLKLGNLVVSTLLRHLLYVVDIDKNYTIWLSNK